MQIPLDLASPYKGPRILSLAAISKIKVFSNTTVYVSLTRPAEKGCILGTACENIDREGENYLLAALT